MINIFIAHFKKNMEVYEALLSSKKSCKSYCIFKDTMNSYESHIFSIESFRYSQRKNFYTNFGFKERLLDFIFCINAKFRFARLRLFLDLLVLYFQVSVISMIILVSSKKILVESGLSNNYNGIALYPSFASYFKNFRNLFFETSQDDYIDSIPSIACNYFVVTRAIIKNFKFKGLIIFFPVFVLESSLFFRSKMNKGNMICFKCLGTMCLINRFFAVIFKANLYEVHLEDHGVPRDCVAEYAIFTKAKGYSGCNPPIKENII